MAQVKTPSAMANRSSMVSGVLVAGIIISSAHRSQARMSHFKEGRSALESLQKQDLHVVPRTGALLSFHLGDV